MPSSSTMVINRLYFDSFKSILAGLPTAVVKSGMSQITTAPAPTVHHLI
jgi:hypothetical protein